MANEESPLIKALPPESDYLTYLTIIEYNLTLENLPILHQVLQDETLATNIGWDLVHLLVPYLPQSGDCLTTIARLGNPREVILKVTESLRLIDYDNLVNEDEKKPLVASESNDARSRADSSTISLRAAETSAETDGTAKTSQAFQLPPPLPLPVNQFVALLDMLSILHPRIKTKYPSRFLSTTLQALLASFSNSVSHREELIVPIVKFAHVVSGSKRPPLPSRHSSNTLASVRNMETAASSLTGGDPEAVAGDHSLPSESALQRKLLQSFITHVLAEYMLNLESGDQDIPGMSWCSRLMEKVHPERTIPETTTFTERFANEEKLHRMIDAVGQLVTLARDLKVTDEELLEAALATEEMEEDNGVDEDDPPDAPEDVPLSRLGSLLLYAARRIATLLYSSSSTLGTDDSALTIFPTHRNLVQNCLSSLSSGASNLGTEPEALIDAILALALLNLENNAVGEPDTNEEFNEYLQIIALLSSNCPSPNLRGHAHYITSTVLRTHPDDKVRLAFIRDTLEHCPFENLKVSAVGWIKGETIEANPPYLTSPTHHHYSHVEGEEADDDHHETSPPLFATPVPLQILAEFLFPTHLQQSLLSSTSSIEEAYIAFRTDLPFYLASLNFLYLLLVAPHLHHHLALRELWTNHEIASGFLRVLKEARERFAKAIEKDGELGAENGGPQAAAELNVLEETLSRVRRAVAAAGEGGKGLEGW